LVGCFGLVVPFFLIRPPSSLPPATQPNGKFDSFPPSLFPVLKKSSFFQTVCKILLALLSCRRSPLPISFLRRGKISYVAVATSPMIPPLFNPFSLSLYGPCFVELCVAFSCVLRSAGHFFFVPFFPNILDKFSLDFSLFFLLRRERSSKVFSFVRNSFFAVLLPCPRSFSTSPSYSFPSPLPLNFDYSGIFLVMEMCSADGPPFF